VAHEFLPLRTEGTKNKESDLLQEFAFAPAASWTGAGSEVRQESVLHSVLNCLSLCSQLMGVSSLMNDIELACLLLPRGKG
jgi:hypothetical protein